MAGMKGNENVFLEKVAARELSIDEEGRIWRHSFRAGKPRHKGSSQYVTGTQTVGIPPKRAESRSRDGYLMLYATINGVKYWASAHRVVYMAKYGPIPAGLTINHKNGVKDDNSLSNLELATMSEQRRHALKVLNVNRNRPKGSKHPKTKLTEADVLEMRRLRAGGIMVKEIAERYGMKLKAVSAIVTKRTWKHI